MEPRIFIGLGSNLGDRENYLNQACAELILEGLGIRAASSIYETPPWGKTDQPPFLNQVLEVYNLDAGLIKFELTPEMLLKVLQAIELRLGRIRREAWGPRTIDLDLLAFGDEAIVTKHLTVPHPGIAARAFVLVPWAQIAPDFLVPVLDRTVSQLCNALPVAERALVCEF